MRIVKKKWRAKKDYKKWRASENCKKNDVQDWQRLAEIREDLPKIIKKQTDEGWQGMLKIRKNIKKNWQKLAKKMTVDRDL